MLAFYRRSTKSVPGEKPTCAYRVYERRCGIQVVASENSGFLLLAVVPVFHMTSGRFSKLFSIFYSDFSYRAKFFLAF
jgi:hypothetical protein